MTEIKYPKSFLTNVIVRIDHTSPITDFATVLPKDLTKKAYEFFPILEPQEVVLQNLSLSPEGKEERSEIEMRIKKEWKFFGKNREKQLTLTADTLFISYKQYESFEKLKTEFLQITQQLFNSQKDHQVRRFGLRYINNVTIDEADLTNWSLYLNENLLCALSIPENKDTIVRAFNNLSINYGEMILTFNYGMYNADLPALITQKAFILDFDAYRQGPQDYSDLEKNIDIFHQRIQDLFEASIKEELRKKMR